MAPKLYLVEHSPSVRFVLLTAKALGIALEQIPVDLSKGEHRTPQYVNLNPQHTVPTLDDDGKIIWDSHAICIYLVSKYGKDNSLYPEDPYKRAIVNQRLHFNSAVMFYYRKEIFKYIERTKSKIIAPELAAAMVEGYGFFEKFLEGHQWAAGDELTLADLCLIPTVTFNDILVPIDRSKFPNVSAWIKKAESLPYYGISRESLDHNRKVAYDYFNS